MLPNDTVKDKIMDAMEEYAEVRAKQYSQCLLYNINLYYNISEHL